MAYILVGSNEFQRQTLKTKKNPIVSDDPMVDEVEALDSIFQPQASHRVLVRDEAVHQMGHQMKRQMNFVKNLRALGGQK